MSWVRPGRHTGPSGVVCCVLSRFSRVQLCVTPWALAHLAPLSMGFSRQDYWIGLPCPPPGDCHNPGIKPPSLKSPVLSGYFFATSATCEGSILNQWDRETYKDSCSIYIRILLSHKRNKIGSFVETWMDLENVTWERSKSEVEWGEVKWKLLSRVWLLATPQTMQSMEFSRSEYWSG